MGGFVCTCRCRWSDQDENQGAAEPFPEPLLESVRPPYRAPSGREEAERTRAHQRWAPPQQMTSVDDLNAWEEARRERWQPQQQPDDAPQAETRQGGSTYEQTVETAETAAQEDRQPEGTDIDEETARLREVIAEPSKASPAQASADHWQQRRGRAEDQWWTPAAKAASEHGHDRRQAPERTEVVKAPPMGLPPPSAKKPPPMKPPPEHLRLDHPRHIPTAYAPDESEL